MINIILAENHHTVRNTLKNLLEKDADLKIVADTACGNELLNLLKTGCIADILLVNINKLDIEGLSLIKLIKQQYPHLSIIMLSVIDNEEFIIAFFKEGISAYLFKNIEPLELKFAIKHVHSGQRYICSEFSLSLLDKLTRLSKQEKDKNLKHNFSSREIEILHLIADGFTNQEISNKLFISKRTIEGYRQNLIQKIKVKNTAALVKYAFLNGILNEQRSSL
ncbi:LuxR C-terminal-related transcriptional regulator [Pedobacter glucosidilyticus]|uniref:LuxR C-terminal-related transcriptional regulator n=1 Tax=Pedobacter glucosidilyticus TaxID=1122941 RepID=UPI00040BB36C|nr:response regulator transcription factor [Pedobacter glucosidilyticus]